METPKLAAVPLRLLKTPVIPRLPAKPSSPTPWIFCFKGIEAYSLATED